jgi:hypothetical protein
MASFTGEFGQLDQEGSAPLTDAKSGYTGKESTKEVGASVTSGQDALLPSALVKQQAEGFPVAQGSFTAYQNPNTTPDPVTIADQPVSQPAWGGPYTDAIADYPGQTDPQNTLVNAYAYIPLKYFHRVTGVVRDPDGNPIEGAKFIATGDNFGTVGQVDPDTGEYEIYLLRVPYEEFFLGVPEDDEYDLVWYRAEGGDLISGFTNEADLTFVPESIPSPLDARMGMRVGI